MTTHIGNEGTVQIGTSDTLGEIKSFSVTERAATADDSAIGDASDTHLIGSKSWEGQATCLFDPADTNGQEALLVGGSVTLNLYPIGSSTGDRKIAGTATVTEVGISNARNTAIERTFRFQGNGPLTHSTVS